MDATLAALLCGVCAEVSGAGGSRWEKAFPPPHTWPHGAAGVPADALQASPHVAVWPHVLPLVRGDARPHGAQVPHLPGESPGWRRCGAAVFTHRRSCRMQAKFPPKAEAPVNYALEAALALLTGAPAATPDPAPATGSVAAVPATPPMPAAVPTDATDGPMLMCACCGRMGDHARACSGCLQVYYCSDACQHTYGAIHAAHECTASVARLVRDATRPAVLSRKGRPRVRETAVPVETHFIKVGDSFPTMLGNAWVRKLGAVHKVRSNGEGHGTTAPPAKAPTSEEGREVSAAVARTAAGTRVRDLLHRPTRRGRRAAAAVGPGAPYVAPTSEVGKGPVTGVAVVTPASQHDNPTRGGPWGTAVAVATSAAIMPVAATADEEDDPTAWRATGIHGHAHAAPAHSLRAAVLARMAAGGACDATPATGELSAVAIMPAGTVTLLGSAVSTCHADARVDAVEGEGEEEPSVSGDAAVHRSAGATVAAVVAAAMEGEDEVTGM